MLSAANFELLSAALMPTEDIRDCLNESFSDYLISLPKFDDAGWQMFLRRQGIDLSLSLVGVRDNRVMSFSLVSPRGIDRWRIAVMGARPIARGTGIAARLLDETIAAAARLDLRGVELEVFAQNARALRLYQSRGFVALCALHGYEAVAGTRGGQHQVSPVSVDEAACWALAFERDHATSLPWQVGGDALRAVPGSPVCLRLEGAQIVYSEATGAVTVLSLLDLDPEYRAAVALLDMLRASFPEAILRAPQLQAQHGPAIAFLKAGWVQHGLYQLLMRRDFAEMGESC